MAAKSPVRSSFAHQLLVCAGCFLVLAGCGERGLDHSESSETPQSAEVAPPSRFDPSVCGSISGRVTWDGPIPAVPPFRVHSSGVPNKSHLVGLTRLNPNALEVQSATRGVHQAIVMLSGVDPATARPWDYAPVAIEMHHHSLEILEGDSPIRTGFVKRGAAVVMSSRDPFYHCLRARGAAAFSLPFFQAGPRTVRKLERAGLVELTSGAGYYWMCGYLFVADHPYYARSDRAGDFRMAQVPPGKYKITCWHPGWHVIRQERDPESSLISRITFAPPLEIEQEVIVQPNLPATVDFTLRAGSNAR
ncbi:MAG: carboxypeptidase regulatory-like domain-containing protein [Planctomycetes bacterium]|nr:carboxypeptidase regulatory-like domain-containing protein [Planctomycetota bacterium]